MLPLICSVYEFINSNFFVPRVPLQWVFSLHLRHSLLLLLLLQQGRDALLVNGYQCGLWTQVRWQLPPVWAQRPVVPSPSAAASPLQQATLCGKCAGTTSTTRSCWRTSRAPPSASATKTPKFSSPPRTTTPAPSPSRTCSLMTRAATDASSTFIQPDCRKERHASASSVSLFFF